MRTGRVERKQKVNWLHISDLHTGMVDQQWLWPRLKRNFLEDIKEVHRLAETIDFVVFSGDLVERGSDDLFSRFDSIRAEIWKLFESLGCSPKLVVLPGNHDLKRPDDNDAYAVALDHWWDDQRPRNGFFADPLTRYRQEVCSYFDSYSNWLSRQDDKLIPRDDLKQGLLPGDQAIRFTVRGLSVGVITLNSTWLQISKGDKKGHLHVDTAQINALTLGDPEFWVSQNDLNLLITHQPTDWLHPESRDHWDSLINPPGRFDAHLFGHMHEAHTSSVKVGGSDPRISIQAPSLFGLEKIEGVITERNHGYALHSFQRTGTKRGVQIYPRILLKLKSGDQKIVPDHTHGLDTDNSFHIDLPSKDIIGADDDDTSDDDDSRLIARPHAIANADLPVDLVNKLSHPVLFRKPHQHIRQIEHIRASSILTHQRILWLASPWNYGSEEFIGAMTFKSNPAISVVYRIDVGCFGPKELVNNFLKSNIGVDLEELSAALIEQGTCYLILDNVPTHDFGVVSPMTTSTVEEIARSISRICPELKIIIKADRVPEGSQIAVLTLSGLDEADVKTYMQDHELSSSIPITSEAVTALHIQSDGIPSDLDEAIRSLNLSSVAEIGDINNDYQPSVTDDITLPSVIEEAINELQNSGNPNFQRAFKLLEVICAVPQGEKISKVKSTYTGSPFYIRFARYLEERGILTAVSTKGFQGENKADDTKILVVPRAIRDFVRRRAGYEQLTEIDRRVSNLYFGLSWESGQIDGSSGYRFDDPHRGNHEIRNACTLIIRKVNRSLSSGDDREKSVSVSLASNLMSLLIDGGHYQNAVSLGFTLIHLYPDIMTDRLAYLNYQMGRCLRMLGQHERAKDYLLQVVDHPFTADTAQGVLLNLSMCCASLKELDDAIDFAKRTISLAGKTGAALNAKAIIVEHDTRVLDKLPILTRLEKTSRRMKAASAANNMALDIADIYIAAARDGLAKGMLGRVLKSSSTDGDFYNGVRAIIKETEIDIRIGKKVGVQTIRRLIATYHYLRSEKIPVLFEGCHSVVWDILLAQNDIDALCGLFRLSSGFWRVTGNLRQEKHFARTIARIIREALVQNIDMLSFDMVYCYSRAAHFNVL